MDSFVKFNKYDNKFETKIDLMIPSICKKNIKDGNEKCINHYNKLQQDIFTTCPYGFYSILNKDEILTCLTPIGCRGLKEIKKKKEDTSNFIILDKEKLLEIIHDYYTLKNENDWLQASIHDLKNIAMYFNSMEFDLRQDFPEESQNNDSFISMLQLYNLMTYRLSLIGSLPEQGYQKKSIPIHSLLLKLIRILKYRAKNKNVSFQIDNIECKIIGNDHLYLAFFTLIDNAVKYAPPGSDISFYFKKDKEFLTVNIENIGPRLDNDEISFITDRHYRGRNNGTTGNGVGLSVYKEICDRCEYDYKFMTKYLNPHQSLFTASIKLKIADKD